MKLLIGDLRSTIDSARKRLEELFIRQCRDGAQSRPLLQYGAMACGQFIGDSALGLHQRGLHGTAAALSVVARSSDPRAAEVTRQIVNYIQRRGELEARIGPSGERAIAAQAKRELDDSNVIKMSEILYALKFVRVGKCPTDALVGSIADRIQSGITKAGGWGYFLDSGEEGGWDPLPTAYALRALSAHQFDVEEPRKLLREKLRDAFRPGVQGANWDIAVQALVLYCLLEIEAREAGRREDLSRLLKELWKLLAPLLLREDLEQNIEYWHREETFYVRVPLQLYLLRLASGIAPLRFFGSRAAQVRLRSILHSVSSQGFRYPHSGSMLSSRTNAIVYDVLVAIEEELKPSWYYQPMFTWELVREVLGARPVMWMGVASGLGLASYSVIEWLRKGGRISEIAPEFIGGLGMFFLSLRKPK